MNSGTVVRLLRGQISLRE